MARKKVKLAYIISNASRKATYNKRKKGLLKKVNEIATLCDIAAGAIIYSPFDPSPVVWPSIDGMRQVITQYRDVPQNEREKNTYDQEKFLQERIDKVTAHWKRQSKENREAYLTEVMYQCLLENMGVSDVPSWELNNLAYVIRQFLNSLDRRIAILGGSDMETGEPSNAVEDTDPFEPLGTLAPANTFYEVGSSSSAAAAAAAGAPLFYPQFPQQFYQPSAPYSGLYDEQSRNQNQFMGMMNPHERMGYAAPFMDYNRQAYYNHHQPQPQPQPQQHQFFPGESSTPRQLIFFRGESSTAPQQQLFPGESSTAQPAATSGSVTPATTPNPTNNIWFNN